MINGRWYIYSLEYYSTFKKNYTRETKELIDKLDYIWLKSFSTAKKKINKMKMEPTVWKNIFANDTSGKGLISKYMKNLYNSN